MTSKIKNKNIKLNKRKIIIACISIVALIIVSICGVVGFSVYQDTAAFDAQKLLSSGASVMYDDKGEIMYTFGSEENGTRENITYEDLPQVLVDAVVAAEDSRFFEHNGFDLPRIAKAAVGNLMAGGIQSGGSTITQQLIKKTYFPNAQRTYTRKISEIILAIQADKALSKEEIITLYLNKIYFGRSTKSIGISSACRYYFNKDVSELTLPEAAMLAGSLNSPYNYDPYYCLDKATNRRNTILNLMVKHGYITQNECDEAKKTKIENTLASSATNNSTLSAYVDLVTKEVEKRTGLNPKEVQMNIYTYCDTEVQELATALGNGEKYTYSDEDMRMGGAVQSSQDGRIIAVIGGRNYSIGDYSYASAKQQPGSSVKPFLDYGLAFENLDWSTAHSIMDEPFNKGSYSPKNWDRNYHGMVTISNALENSWNIPAVKTFDEVVKEIGESGVKSAMESVGIDMSKQEDAGNLAYAIGGWSTGISPLEMTSTYATISNNGLYTESHAVNYIEVVQTGDVYKIDEEIQDNAKQSDYSKESAYMIRETMIDYTKHGSGSYAYLSGISNCGAKTGTSNWQGGASRDIWMSAFTSDYVCSVWMGFGKEGIDKGKNTSKYKAYPGKVVQSLFKLLQTKKTNKTYPDKPANVTSATIMKGIYPYVLPPEGTAADLTVSGLFKKGTVPSKSFDSAAYNLNNLSSFEATLDASNKVSFKFSPYSPENATTDEKANEATKLFGKVQYTVVVSDSNGQTLHQESFSTPTGTLNYTVSQNVKVTGYYNYEKYPDKTSNKIETTLGIALSNINASIVSDLNENVGNNSTISGTTVKIAVKLQSSSNTCKIVLLDSNGGEISSISQANATISKLSSGSSYTIKIIESNGSSSIDKIISFKVA